MAERLKRLLGMGETQILSLGREDPLEKETAIHSSTLAWKIPCREGESHTLLSDFTYLLTYLKVGRPLAWRLLAWWLKVFLLH